MEAHLASEPSSTLLSLEITFTRPKHTHNHNLILFTRFLCANLFLVICNYFLSFCVVFTSIQMRYGKTIATDNHNLMEIHMHFYDVQSA